MPDATAVESSLTGRALIEDPLWNRGTAFTEEERSRLGLRGLLPPHVESLDEQVARAYLALQGTTSELGQHIYLRALQDTNETLFYRLVVDQLADVMPIIYTPTVGEACLQFSEIYRRPRGLFLSYACRESMDEMLSNFDREDVEVIVVTDGERILGLGDQGAGGMGIPIGKLSLYVACGGIHPSRTLPILLDIGTNNQDLLDDPHYIGWRHERISGQAYDDFVDTFVEAVERRWPGVLLQFEDFAIGNATPMLERYRDRLCMFNDDIQGTASVTLGTLLAATRVTGTALGEQTIALLGGGSAGSGIAEQVIAAMVEDGVPAGSARSRVYVVDRYGLLHDGMEGLRPFQAKLARPKDELADWARSGPNGEITLLDVVRQARPTVLIGVSGQPGLFTEEIVREMASHVQRPIVFPLSNPTSRMEAAPSDLIRWTDGRALVATGSPVDPVSFGKRSYPIAQCNNTYVFPAVGLGVRASGARRVSDEMLRAASRALGQASPAIDDPNALLLPPIESIREVSRRLAVAIGTKAQEQGLADPAPEGELKGRVERGFWEPAYSSR